MLSCVYEDIHIIYGQSRGALNESQKKTAET